MTEEYINIRLSRTDLEIIKEALKKYQPPIYQELRKEMIREKNNLKEFLDK